MIKNVLIAGVGGQGTLLTSRILGYVYGNEGFDVKVSEVHGMSQRGGSVVTYVRYGDKVSSPLIEKGTADIILAFEELEALRWLPFLKKDGLLIVNEQRMMPMPVIAGKAEYPKGIEETFREKGVNYRIIDAMDIAAKLGSVKTSNVVLIGSMAKTTDIEKEKWLQAVKACVPAKMMDINISAFEAGYSI